MKLSIRDIQELIGGRQSPTHSFRVGEKYFIRTVTMHYTGRLIAVTDSDICLNEAARIASAGRFAESLFEGTLSEVEPYPACVYVSRSSIVDFTIWDHELPRDQV